MVCCAGMPKDGPPLPRARAGRVSSLLSRTGAACALLGLVLSASCAKEEKRAGLVVAVQSDMAIPDDVDTIELEVSAYGRKVFSREYPVGPQDLRIPATLTLLPADDTSTPVAIRLVSYHGDEPLTLRRVVTTVPGDREALLRMPIDWLCRGQVKRQGDDVVSTCGDGSSCVAGGCVSDTVDSSDLDDYEPGRVYGGKNADGKGVCFDTVPCFARNVNLADFGLNVGSCTFGLEQSISIDGEAAELAPESLNFALKVEGQGICGDWGCFVPLERDAQTGFFVEDGVAHLPKAACSKLADDVALVLSTACATRTPSIPPCGDWTGVGDSKITVPLDDLPPAGTGGGTGTGGAPSTGGSNSGGGAATGGNSSGGAGTGGSGTGGGSGTLPGLAWLEQFGSTASGVEQGMGVAVFGSSVYVAVNTNDALPGQANAGGQDFALKRYDLNGTLLSAFQYGTADDDYVTAIAVDGGGNVLVAGYTNGNLDAPSAGGFDAFVRKLNPAGNAVLWGHQFGGSGDDRAHSVSVDATGAVLISGATSFELLPGKALGSDDAFVRKLDASGVHVWTEQFGTSGEDFAGGARADSVGNVFVAGSTLGALPGQTSSGSEDSYVMKLTPDGVVLFTRQFGSPGPDSMGGLAVDADGNAIVVGYTSNAFPGRTNAGGQDVFVQKICGSGELSWNRQFGTPLEDVAYSVMTTAFEEVVLVGATRGTLPGQTGQSQDGFLRKYDGDGSELFTLQLGSSETDFLTGVAKDGSGNVYVTGSTLGLLPGTHVATGAADAFVARLLTTEATDPYVAVSAGTAHSCGLKEQGTVRCWGHNSSGQTNVVPGSYAAISAGGSHTCALRDDGTVACWGAQTTAPGGMFKSIAAGMDHTCGILENDTLTCWGNNGYGQTSYPLGQYGSITSGMFVSCALSLPQLTVSCWGDSSHGLMFPPQGSFEQIDLGDRHACGLSGGSLTCWGDNMYGQFPPAGGSWVALSAGQYHTCGVDQYGVTCWGDNVLLQAEPHPSTFSAVSAGGYHTCALKTNGAISCWGDASLGATDVP